MSKLWDVLGRKYAIEVLIHIYKHPGEMQKTIIEYVNFGRSSRLERIEDLKNAGLINESSSGGNWTAITYHVTKEGERVAKGLCSIEDQE